MTARKCIVFPFVIVQASSVVVYAKWLAKKYGFFCTNKYMCYERLKVINFCNRGALMFNLFKLFLDTRTYHCCIQVWVIWKGQKIVQSQSMKEIIFYYPDAWIWTPVSTLVLKCLELIVTFNVMWHIITHSTLGFEVVGLLSDLIWQSESLKVSV